MFFCTGLHSQQLYKPHWHTHMMMPSQHPAAWINQFSKPSSVHPPAPTTPNYSQAQQLSQQSPQSSYPPTPPKDDMRSDNDGTFTPTSNTAGFVYPDYQNGNAASAGSVFKHSSSANSQSSDSPPSAKSKSRARTGTGNYDHIFMAFIPKIDLPVYIFTHKHIPTF